MHSNLLKDYLKPSSTFFKTIFTIFKNIISFIRDGVKKKWYFWVVMAVGGGGRGSRPDHNFRPKKYHFLFLLPFDSEAFKTCKNTIELINLCALPCLGLGPWLTLTVFFDLA